MSLDEHERLELVSDNERLRAELSDARRDESILLIMAERKRQITGEGWTVEHDDAHTKGELADAAACYATTQRARVATEEYHHGFPKGRVTNVINSLWPGWDWKWWKPTPKKRIRELVKAGALIVAEIDRLQRKVLAAPATKEGKGT